MKYEELVANVREVVKETQVSKMIGHVAFQFVVEGEAAGVFYLEIDDGKVRVEPYEYYDRDLIIETSADVIMQMIRGEMQPRVAYTKELLKLYGNEDVLGLLPFVPRKKLKK